MPSFRALLTTTVAAAAGYVAARQLLSDEAPGQIARLPEGAREPLFAARRRLQRATARVEEGIQAGRAEQALAEVELLAEYQRKTNRAP